MEPGVSDGAGHAADDEIRSLLLEMGRMGWMGIGCVTGDRVEAETKLAGVWMETGAMNNAGHGGFWQRCGRSVLWCASAALVLILTVGVNGYRQDGGSSRSGSRALEGVVMQEADEAGNGNEAAGPERARMAGLEYVGSEQCYECHEAETEKWDRSDHRHSMAYATDDSVLGDFNDATFEYNGVTSRMFRDGERFMVETDGPDGALHTYEVKYTFGYRPLQQYLLEMPGGRLQAWTVA